MADFSFLSNGIKPVELPDQLALAQRGMSLANLSQQVQTGNMALQDRQRAQAAQEALNQVLPDVMRNNWSDESVQRAVQQRPEVGGVLLDLLDKKRKADADNGKTNADTFKTTTEGKAKALADISNVAFGESQKPDGMSLSRVQSMANFYKIPLPQFSGDPSNPQDIAGYLSSVGKATYAAKDQVAAQQKGQEIAETGRHNLSTEANSAGTLAETGRHNLSTEGNAAAALRELSGFHVGELQNQRRTGDIRATEVDPYGILGLNNGPQGGATGGGGPPGPAPQQGAPGAANSFGQRPGDVASDAVMNAQAQPLTPQQQQLAAQDQARMQGGPAGGGAIRDAMAANLHGDEFLKALPTPLAAQVKALAEGRQAFPAGAAMRNPQINALLGLVGQYDPTFDAVNYGARSSMARDWGDQGPLGKSNVAINTVIGHLGDLKKSADALNNTSITPLNSAVNYVEDKLGDPRYKVFDANAGAVAKELERAYRGTGGSQGDIDAMKRELASSGSPEQMTGVIQKYVELLQSKIEANADQYKKTMGRDPPPLLSSKSQATADSLRGGGDGKPSGKGFAVTAPDGKTYTFPSESAAFEFKQKAGIRD